jgi:hypothetical protein
MFRALVVLKSRSGLGGHRIRNSERGKWSTFPAVDPARTLACVESRGHIEREPARGNRAPAGGSDSDQ